jgi:16S rRNA (guanine966-N2)-methyltransferase
MVRQAIFNLVPVTEGASFLDLYAGTGSVGLEALSRGARRVVFVEKDLNAARILRRNIQELGYQDKTAVLEKDVLEALPALAAKERPFDVIFVDPPYFQGLIEPTMRVIIACLVTEDMLLAREGWLLVKHSHKEILTWPAGFTLWKTRRYGQTCLTILQKQ